MTTLYLLRHGATPANKEDRFAGRTDESLHPDGCDQIRCVGQGLRGRGIDRIFCGPLPRTRESAAILAEILQVDMVVEENLIEINLPHWDGLTKQAIRQRFDGQYPTWLDAPERFRVAGCETIGDVQARAVAATDRLIAEHAGQRILLVSHLIVIRSLLLHYERRPISHFRRLKVGNAELCRLVQPLPGGAIEVVRAAASQGGEGGDAGAMRGAGRSFFMGARGRGGKGT